MFYHNSLDRISQTQIYEYYLSHNSYHPDLFSYANKIKNDQSLDLTNVNNHLNFRQTKHQATLFENFNLYLFMLICLQIDQLL